MSSLPSLNLEETRVLTRIDSYFRDRRISIKEKVMIADIIAQHELELEQYGSETERQAILNFQRVLKSLVQKL